MLILLSSNQKDFLMNYGMKLKGLAQRKNHLKTIGRPIIPYRKVLDGILYVLRTGCHWKMLPKEYGSGSTCHRRFQEWNRLDAFKKGWIRILKIYDEMIGINWTWQSIDSIYIKSPLRGRRLDTIPLIEAN